MICDYPAVMENELIYVYVLRYHRFCGNSSITRTFKDFFELGSGITGLYFPGNANHFLKQIQMDADTYLRQHSIWPFYKLFVSEAKYQKIKQLAIYDNRNLSRQISQCYDYEDDSLIKNALWYCPICHKERKDFSDIKIFHQIPGVYVCEKHHCRLKALPIKKREFLSTPEKWDVSFETCDDKWLNEIAEDVKYVMEYQPDIFVDSISKRIKDELKKLIVVKGKKLVEAELLGQYKELPMEYQDYYKRFTLDRYLLGKSVNPYVTPMEYIILIRIMFGSLEEFVENQINILEKL